MRLSGKLMLISFTLLLLFFLSSLPSIYQNDSIYKYANNLLFFLLGYFLIQSFIIKPIVKLNQKLIRIEDPTRKNQLLSKNNQDELSHIASVTNDSLMVHEASVNLNDRVLFLENANAKLVEEISALTSRLGKTPSFVSFDRKNETLHKLAHYDELTSLPNRIFFNEILNKTISHAKRHKKIVSLLLIDIKGLNQINQKYGIEKGDKILKEISSRLQSSLRSDDVLARFESDEFIVLLNDIGQAKFASSVAEKIIESCSKPFNVEEDALEITISIGVCIYPNDGDSLEELMKNIDAALNKAKSNPQSAYQFYAESLDREAREFKTLDTALKQAIKNNELALYYQPKLNLKRGRITGVEALIRWIHPKLGMINPTIFVNIADETGFGMQLAEWALLEASRMNKHWQDEGYEHFSVSINLSAKQFNHPQITKAIENALNISGLNPDYLEIEINESTVMDKVEEAASILSAIKATGVQITIDHFGVGYTSINFLKKFPISTLKIDQTFIKGVPLNPNDMAITNAIISLAHHLGLDVVAQGVETAEQVQYLVEQNCDMIQGYFLSHPLPAQKIEKQFTKLSDEVLL